ncbi:hypothetical protein [Halorubrum cibi]|uniref:Uncharacterized protein n=1 Tax=Halorubrum cibi TaxID=413815 RepID=A0A521CZW8_9EURY|nr:hypothetical protein [Halorubrum cibi]SMO64974.1 hypothetical protein SAMN06264867_105239 [Halorubrum cibi]
MDGSDTVLLGVSVVVAVTVIAAVVVAGLLFGFGESVLRPFALLAAEPFAWIVVAALLVAVVGHAYIE